MTLHLRCLYIFSSVNEVSFLNRNIGSKKEWSWFSDSWIWHLNLMWVTVKSISYSCGGEKGVSCQLYPNNGTHFPTEEMSSSGGEWREVKWRRVSENVPASSLGLAVAKIPLSTLPYLRTFQRQVLKAGNFMWTVTPNQFAWLLWTVSLTEWKIQLCYWA